MHIRANFKKNLKSCSLIVKNVLIKNICDVYKLLKTLKIYYQIFGNLCQLWNLCNEERQILKNSIFDGSLIINHIFQTTCYWQIRFCTYYAFSLNQMSDIREVWKYWSLKDGFSSILQKVYRAAILWWMDQKNSNF